MQKLLDFYRRQLTVDIVAVKLCASQSALKQQIVVSRGWHLPQCPTAGDANVKGIHDTSIQPRQ